MADVWEEDDENCDLKIAEIESSKNEEEMTKVCICIYNATTSFSQPN